MIPGRPETGDYLSLWLKQCAHQAKYSRRISEVATSFGEVAGGLNQMTIGRFEKLIAASPFKLADFELVPIRPFRRFHNRLTREFTTTIVRCRFDFGIKPSLPPKSDPPTQFPMKTYSCFSCCSAESPRAPKTYATTRRSRRSGERNGCSQEIHWFDQKRPTDLGMFKHGGEVRGIGTRGSKASVFFRLPDNYRIIL